MVEVAARQIVQQRSTCPKLLKVMATTALKCKLKQRGTCSLKDVAVIQFHWQSAVVIISDVEAKKKCNGKWPHSKFHALFHYYDIQASKCEGILVGCKQTSQRQRKWASDLERIPCQLAFATVLCVNWVTQWVVQWTSLRVHSFQLEHRSLKEKTEDHIVSSLSHLSDPLLLTQPIFWESPHRAQAAHRHLYQHPILATAATLTRIHPTLPGVDE